MEKRDVCENFVIIGISTLLLDVSISRFFSVLIMAIAIKLVLSWIGDE